MESLKINPAQFVPMNAFAGPEHCAPCFRSTEARPSFASYPLRVDLAYAPVPDGVAKRFGHHFPDLYPPHADWLWLHQDLARVVLVASLLARRLYGWTLFLMDGLCPLEAAASKSSFDLNKYAFEAHSRGMAVDIVPCISDFLPVDFLTNSKSVVPFEPVPMGTAFDFHLEGEGVPPVDAPSYVGGWDADERADADAFMNRQKLAYVMRRAAALCGVDVRPFQHRWWCFGLASYERFPAVSEGDLLPYQRLVTLEQEDVVSSLDEMAEDIRRTVQQLHDDVGAIPISLSENPNRGLLPLALLGNMDSGYRRPRL